MNPFSNNYQFPPNNSNFTVPSYNPELEVPLDNSNSQVPPAYNPEYLDLYDIPPFYSADYETVNSDREALDNESAPKNNQISNIK